MSHLNVTQQDADKSQAARDDYETILEQDARVGPGSGDPLAVAGLFKAAGVEANSQILDFGETVALAVVRAMRAHPVALPSYTLPAVPTAANHTGALIHVTNGAGGLPILAFSDGADWLRCDTRGVISVV